MQQPKECNKDETDSLKVKLRRIESFMLSDQKNRYKKKTHRGQHTTKNIKDDYKLSKLKQEMRSLKSKEKILPKNINGIPSDRQQEQRLPPVCGRSPPCYCPEDQLFASKLRIQILKKISSLRRQHIKLRDGISGW